MKKKTSIFILIILSIPILLSANPRQYEKVKGMAGYHKKFTGYYGPFYIMDQHTKDISNAMLQKMGMKQLNHNNNAQIKQNKLNAYTQQTIKKPSTKRNLSFSKMSEKVSNQGPELSKTKLEIITVQDIPNTQQNI